MKALVALVYIASASALLPGQTRSPDEANPIGKYPGVYRVKRLAREFPPELVAATTIPATVMPLRSYCVYSSARSGTWLLSIKPCRTSPRMSIVLPAVQNRVPRMMPATAPGGIR
jgi:hypothetical protein